MAHVSEKKSVRMKCVDLEQINMEMSLEQLKIHKPIKSKQVESKPVKRALLKLFKKAKLNAKYLEHVIPIQNIKCQQVNRNFGIK